MIVWLLDLDLGGTVFRFATSAASITDGSSTRVYRPGLADPTVDIGSDGPTGRSVALSISATPDGYTSWVDVPHIRSMLEQGSAVLRRWTVGDVLSKAQVLARGSLASPSIARGNEPLVLSLESPPWQDGTRVIAPSHMVTTKTYPSPSAKTYPDSAVDPQVYGSYPPVVIGYPGNSTDTSNAGTVPQGVSVQGPPVAPVSRVSKWSELTEGSPALKVELNVGVWSWYDRAAIASHPVAASSVIIWDQSDERWDLFTVSHQINGLGQTFAYIEYTGANAWLRSRGSAGHELWAVWLPEYGGGLKSDAGGTMTGLGEVLKWMLAKMGTPVALSAQQGERGDLDLFKINAYINTDITVWEWVSQEVLELFPVRWVETDEGGYLRYWDLLPGAQPVAVLNTATQAISVVSDLLCDTTDVGNFLTLRYNFGPDGVHKFITLAADAGASGGNQRVNAACARSESIHGRRARTWESKTVADDATASRLLNHLALKHALGTWSLIVADPQSKVLTRLAVGDRVTLTASSVGLTAQDCIVAGIVYEGQETRAMLELVEEV